MGLGRAASLLLVLLSALHAQVRVAGRVVDENGAPVAGAALQFRNPAYLPHPATTSDAQGRFELGLGQPGEYSIRAERPGFFVLDHARVGLHGGANEVTVTLNHLQEFVESIDVVYSPPVVDPAQTSDQKQLNNLEVLGVPYPASQDLRSALPMFPGVVQDTGGRVHVNGGSGDQTNVMLNGFNISDPVTGLFEARVSIESVRTMDLESGRFSADSGRGSAGSLNIETGMGDDRFRFGATNFVPGVSTERGLILSKWTPRVTLSGPIARSRAWFHNGVDAFYDVDTVRELPRGQDRAPSLTTSNLSRIQVNIAPSNILTGSYLINYVDRDHQGLSFLDPIETTSHNRRSLNMATLRDQIYRPGGTLFEVGFAMSRGVIRQNPRGPDTFVISPEGRRGNYFVDLARHSNREQWVANLFLPTFHARGSHQFKLGADLQRSGFQQTSQRHDYRVLREDGSTARYVSFAGNDRLHRTNFESATYAQDHWTPREGLVLELGLRADWDQIVRHLLLSPRVSTAWAPLWMKGTKVAAGFGVFNDPLNLEMLTRHQDQTSISTFYAPDGSVAMGPVQSGFLANERSLEAPRARTYTLSLERILPHRFYGKASYLRRVGWNGFAFVEPAGGLTQPKVFFELRNQRSDRYDALEFATRRTFAGQFEWVASYTYSRARSSALVDYDLENPIFGDQGGGPLAWDAPHRFLTWGWAPVPAAVLPRLLGPVLRELSVAYLLETRSGFPFSVVNEENFLAGRPNQRRLPGYFSLNLHFEKKFRFLHWLWAWRFGLNNLTNHGNPNVVNNNIDSPSFLTYGRGQQRAWNVRLRFLGKR